MLKNQLITLFVFALTFISYSQTKLYENSELSSLEHNIEKIRIENATLEKIRLGYLDQADSLYSLLKAKSDISNVGYYLYKEYLNIELNRIKASSVELRESMKKLIQLIDALYTRNEELKSEQELVSNEKLSIWDTINEKVDWFIKDKQINTDLNNIPKDFLNFHNKFITDSIYQQRHIDFKNIVGVYGECDTTIYINKENWIFSTWDFLKFFNIDNNIDSIDGWDNQYYFDNTSFYYQFDLKEVGIIYQVGFEKVNNEWRMTLYYLNNC